MWILTILLGLLIGSFLNVCIYRIPRKESIVFGSSHCTNCNQKIRTIDLIPVLSYVILKGRCRYCGEGISLQYPFIELLNAVLYLLCYFSVGLSTVLIPMLAMCSVLIVISFIDIKTKEIPNGLVLFVLVLGIANVIINSEVTWKQSLIGFFAVSIPMLVIAIISKGGMGGGDIKLMAATGVFLGWSHVLVAFFIACLAAGLIGGVLILIKNKNRKDLIPFGPFLAGGVFTVMLYGEAIIYWYLGIAGVM